MKERMDTIWEIVREKQALEEAARRLREKRHGMLGWKLSVSAACGLIITLFPAAGAAQSLVFLL